MADTIKETTSGRTKVEKVFEFLCVCWVLMHVYAAWRMPFSLDELKVLHLGLGAAIVFFLHFQVRLFPKKLIPWLWLVLSIGTLVVTIHFFVDYENMIERTGFPSITDVVVGSIFTFLVLLATWRSWGIIIPTITLAVLLYGLFGEYLSGFFYHSGLEYPRFIGYCSTYFMGTLGSLSGLSASVIIHFIIFGALLQACGGSQLIEKISFIIGTRFRSGPAQTAIISSGFMGMVSGSTAANVAVTGAFTIPLMKRRGFHPDFAGAVEAVASTGGQIMPPIMGVSAFIMAGLTNKTYASIVIAAFLPALVYFLNLSFAVFVRTRKEGITLVDRNQEEQVYRIRDVIINHGHLTIPIIILTWRVVIGETPARAILYGNASLLVVGLIHTVLVGFDRLGEVLKEFGWQVYSGLLKGAKEGAKLGVILGSMGIIVEMFTVTGFGQRLSYAMVEFSSGNSFVLIFLVAILTIFFGMGMPTPGAYLLTVLLSAPALIKFGFPELQVHFYVFYFAIISSVTPPVAIAVLVAIGISGGRFLGSAVHALRLAIPGFLMPLYFLYKPVILDLGANPIGAIMFNGLLLVGMVGMCIVFDGFFIRHVGWIARSLCFAGALMIFHPSTLYSWFGFAIIAVFGGWHLLLQSRRIPENILPNGKT